MITKKIIPLLALILSIAGLLYSHLFDYINEGRKVSQEIRTYVAEPVNNDAKYLATIVEASLSDQDSNSTIIREAMNALKWNIEQRQSHMSKKAETFYHSRKNRIDVGIVEYTFSDKGFQLLLNIVLVLLACEWIFKGRFKEA